MFLIILLIGHMIADYFLQSSKMAEDKKKDKKALLMHSAIYLLVFGIINFIFIQPQFAIWATLIISITHLIIDLFRTKIDNKFKDYRVCFFCVFI